MNQKEFDEKRKIAESLWLQSHTGQNEHGRLMAMQNLLADAIRSLLPNDKSIALRTETCVQCGKQETDPIGWIIVKSINALDPKDNLGLTSKWLMYCVACTTYRTKFDARIKALYLRGMTKDG